MARLHNVLWLACAALCGCSGTPPGALPSGPPAPLPPLDLAAPLQGRIDPGGLIGGADRLRRHLSHADFPVREEASRALGALGPPAVHYLALLHADQDPEVSSRVRRSLERLGWPGDALVALAGEGGGPAAPFLASVLRERSIDRAGPGIAALARIGGGPARVAVEPLLREEEPKVRYHAARALGAIGDPAAIPALERLRQDGDQGVRFAAAASLRRLGREEAYEALAAALQSAVGEHAEEVGLYNLACLAALSGRPEEACDWMAKACQRGFHDPAAADADPDFYEMRENPAWHRLLQAMGRQRSWDP